LPKYLQTEKTMATNASSVIADSGIRSVRAAVPYLASSCSAPRVNNGDFTQNVFPLEERVNTILDGETLPEAPSLDVEGFCRVRHEFDVTGLEDSAEAAVRLRESLAAMLKEMTGADEVHILPFSMVRSQKSTSIAKDIEKGVPAPMAHADNTDFGAATAEHHFYPKASRPEAVRRTAQVNMWKLLSSSPTPCPLALADVRSVRADDIVPGPAYFPSIDASIDTAFFHPNDHFRWVYYSKLTNQELLIFKQYDSDKSLPVRVPHTAFDDPSCPANAEPRASIENRALLRWY
jgi:hypothetical protein